MEGLVRVPVREQEPKVRATNFEEYVMDTTRKRQLQRLPVA